jgi:N-methylhydantoinase A/oxoprolinase/acetone carboxylase beta subunit
MKSALALLAIVLYSRSGVCRNFPVWTFSSGPTNSMRGAAFLSKMQDDSLKNAIVADIGGTSTDVGQLVNGFPRQASHKTKVGGVYTNFRMPDLFSIGLGGGSHVQLGVDKMSVGPLSVGRELTEKGQSFGGNILTTTDAAIKAGICYNFGSSTCQLSTDEAKSVMRKCQEMIEAAIDQIKISATDSPLLIVGGGALLIDRNAKLMGVSKLVVPKYHDVANAVGAAIAQVSGLFDKIITGFDREKAVDEAKKKAIEAAVEAGAKRWTVEIIDIAEIPLSYLPGRCTH